MALSPDGRKLYVANLLFHDIVVINTVTWRRKAGISLSGAPDALAISPDGHYLYVANFGDDTVSQVQISATGSG